MLWRAGLLLALGLTARVTGAQRREEPSSFSRALSFSRSCLGVLRGGRTEASVYSPPVEWAPLSREELRVLKLLRERFRGREGAHDDLLLLAVRGFAHEADWPAASAEALEHMLAIRTEVGADSVLEEGAPQRAAFCSLYVTGHCGFDRDGHPVYYERVGRIDPRKLFAAFPGADGVEQLLHNSVFVQEAIRRLKLRRTLETGRRVYKHVVVIDLDGLRPHHLSKRLLRVIQRMLAFHQAAYPETLHSLYIVNAPKLFSLAWGLVRPLLHPLTADKVRVLGHNVLEELAADGIDESQVPDFLGGGGGDLDQFWESEGGVEAGLLDHYLQRTAPGRPLQDISEAEVDGEEEDVDPAAIERLRPARRKEEAEPADHVLEWADTGDSRAAEARGVDLLDEDDTPAVAAVVAEGDAPDEAMD